jgi:GNAT superfamily N-acetyltransferase
MASQPAIEIKSLRAEDTWPLRQLVLWPNREIDFVKLPDDHLGWHFGAVQAHILLSVLSVFFYPEGAQIRKFATHTKYQGQGIGSVLLRQALRAIAERGAGLVWLDARAAKAGFYQRFGFCPGAEPFVRNGQPYLRMELRFGETLPD